jgi:serine/threonine protein kinase
MKTAIMSSDVEGCRSEPMSTLRPGSEADPRAATTLLSSELGHAEHEGAASASAREQDMAGGVLAGATIAGKYAIRRVLGRGGFGVVYEAEHVGLSRKVAIKVYHVSAPALLAGPDCGGAEMLSRIEREARLSALVRHPNVVEVYDTGKLDDGSPYLVMEFIEGETLARRLDRGPLSIAAVVELGCQLLGALEAISRHDMVHRDVKPENVMLQRSFARAAEGALRPPAGDIQEVKLVDFGICKQLLGAFTANMTQEGMLIGTPLYMPPEQISGHAVDHRSDLYSVGAVLYEATTGQPPHPAESLVDQVVATLHGRLRSPRKLRPDCPPQLARLLLKALAREPGRRPASAREMQEALDRIASEHRLVRGDQAWCEASSPATPGQSGLMRRGRLGLWAIGAAAAAAFLLALGSKSELADAQSGPGDQVVPGAEVAPLSWSLGSSEVFNEALAKMPAPEPAAELPAPEAHGDSWPRLMRRALASYVRGDLKQAQQLYQRATDLEPTRAAGWRGLALAAGRLRRHDEARSAFAQYSQLAEPRERQLVEAHLAQWQAL